MRRFSVVVRVRDADNLFSSVTVPDGVELTPESWSDTLHWGYDEARIAAAGPVESLEQLLTWVGEWVQIRNEFDSVVWAGRIHEVEMVYGGVSVSVNLDDVYNRIDVEYANRTASGGEESATTGWADATSSQDRYGVRELRLSLPEGASIGASALRTRALAAKAWPPPVVTTVGGSGTPRATIYCKSHFYDLGTRYYTNEDGVVEYEESGDAEQAVWATLTSTSISFAATNKINGPSGAFNNLRAGDTLHVAGAANAANNGTFTVAETPSTSTQVKVSESTLVNESAGASVSISYGHAEARGIAQSFQLPAGAGSWTAKSLAVRLRRYDPNDVGIAGNIVVELKSDSSGSPGTLLDEASLTGPQTNALATDTAWVEFELDDGDALLNPSTTYWVVVRQTTAGSLGRHIAVDVDEALGYSGAVKVWNGSSWVARSPDCHMPFRVLGTADGLGMVVDMIKTGVGASSNTDVYAWATGHEIWQYRDGSRTMLDEAETILEMGTSGGKPVMVRWSSPPLVDDGRVIVIEQPTVDETVPILRRDGMLYQFHGEPWEPGRLVAGSWVQMEGLPALTGMTNRQRALWVISSEYNARTDTLSIETEGARDVFAGIGRRAG